MNQINSTLEALAGNLAKIDDENGRQFHMTPECNCELREAVAAVAKLKAELVALEGGAA